MALISLTAEQAESLRDALVASAPSAGAMDTLMLKLERSFSQLSLADRNFPENVMVVVRRAEAQDWLLALIDRAREAVPAEPRFEALRRDLARLAPPPGVDHFKASRLTGSYVMVDRTALRRSVREIHAPLGKRILVVTGATKTGKSHTLQYIAYLREVLDNFRFVYVDLETYMQRVGAPRVIEPIDIARTLVRKLGYDLALPERPSDMQWANWILEFCDAIEPLADADQHRRWIVIDAFNKVVMTQQTLDLVQQLAARVGQSLGSFRLVLLGYDDRLPDAVGMHVQREHIEPIDMRDLLEFFAAAHAQCQVPCDEDVLEATLERVLDGLDMGDEDFLAEVSPRISDELARMAGDRR
jgi:hypothetical protein